VEELEAGSDNGATPEPDEDLEAAEASEET
jgi:hypothetical protein